MGRKKEGVQKERRAQPHAWRRWAKAYPTSEKNGTASALLGRREQHLTLASRRRHSKEKGEGGVGKWFWVVKPVHTSGETPATHKAMVSSRCLSTEFANALVLDSSH